MALHGNITLKEVRTRAVFGKVSGALYEVGWLMLTRVVPCQGGPGELHQRIKEAKEAEGQLVPGGTARVRWPAERWPIAAPWLTNRQTSASNLSNKLVAANINSISYS